MARRPRTVHRCRECGHEEPKWVGRCPDCEAWGTLAEVTPAPAAPAPTGADGADPVRPLHEVALDEVDRAVTGIGELDRVLGGGLVRGGAVLLGGEPGVGKSTLLLQAADAVAGTGRWVLYVSGEESAGQVRLRAQRLEALHPRLLVTAETSLPGVLQHVERHRPDVLVLDSIQAVTDPEQGSAAGSVVQVRDCATALTRVAKQQGMATVLVGHVTKEGNLAGPRVLEHLVDTVLAFEGDRHHALRLLRATKNRFGAAGEVGCFEMAGEGLVEVSDPTFLVEHEGSPSGVAVTVAVEGPRPLAVEVQALAVDAEHGVPRRQATGLDPSRVAMLTAVLERHAGIALGRRDLYTSAVGGVRLHEPASDLAVCLALASAGLDASVRPGLVALGEVGLAGEVRTAPRLSQRLAEAARVGLTAAVVPAAYDGDAHGLELHRVTDIRGALHAGGPTRAGARARAGAA